MKIISHRGNLNGSNEKSENTFQSINSALDLGFDVEIDTWYIHNNLYLGHDLTNLIQYDYIESFLLNNWDKLWIHCKNIDALVYLLDFKLLNVFGHSNDDYVLTSKGNIFCKPGVSTNKKSIIVMPETVRSTYTEELLNNCYGILTDYPINIKEKKFGLFTI